MATTTISAVLDWVATQVAAVTPSDSVSSFVEVDNFAPTFDEAVGSEVGALDRSFVVKLGSESAGPWFGDAFRQVETSISVEIAYQPSKNRTEVSGGGRVLQRRIGLDRELIYSRLLKRTGFPSGVRKTESGGAGEPDDRAGPDTVIARISVLVTYHVAVP